MNNIRSLSRGEINLCVFNMWYHPSNIHEIIWTWIFMSKKWGSRELASVYSSWKKYPSFLNSFTKID